PAFERPPRLDLVAALDKLAEHGLDVLRLDLRQEPDLADVDAEQRHVVLDDRVGGAQERPIAAEHDEDIGPWQFTMQGVVVRGGRRPLGEVVRLRPARGALAQLDGGIAGRVVGEPDATNGLRLGHGQEEARAGRRRWSRNSRLPSGPRIGDAISPAGCMPSSIAAAVTSRTTRAWTAGSRTTPLSVSPLPASNCGLTSPTRSPPAGSNVDTIGASTRRSEMNDTSTVARVTGSGSEVAVSVRALVRSIETTRGSLRSRSASCPRPTSTAYTRRAPRWSSTSVNPPVEAPTSRQ